MSYLFLGHPRRLMIEACPDGPDAVTQADIDDIIDDIRKAILLGDDA